MGGENGRIGQSGYWTVFGINMVAVPLLLAGALWSLVNGSYGAALLMFLAIIPVGLYFRVIMMRRCRDIGWPAFLPWLLFGLQFMQTFFTLSGSLSAPKLGSDMIGARMVLPLVIGMADFIFSIIIGCIKSAERRDYARIFGDGLPDSPTPSTAGGGPNYDRFDEAVARAMAQHKQAESAAPETMIVPARPAGGFGRRGLKNL